MSKEAEEKLLFTGNSCFSIKKLTIRCFLALISSWIKN